MRPKSKSSLVIKYQIKNRTHSRFLHLYYSFLSILLLPLLFFLLLPLLFFLLLPLLFFLLLNSWSFFHSPNSTQRSFLVQFSLNFIPSLNCFHFFVSSLFSLSLSLSFSPSFSLPLFLCSFLTPLL